MIKVMLIDDEVLALDYLKNLIPWEEHGYRIVGCMTCGKSAINLFRQEKPEIVISDIRMAGMDGLELARRLREYNSDVIIILLSAYKDFTYAQQGIRYGVSDYLVKHELNEEVLLKELGQVRERLDAGYEKKKVYQQYFMKQLIYNQVLSEPEKNKLGKRFFLLMLQKSNYYENANSRADGFTADEYQSLVPILEESLQNIIFYIADTQITPNHLMVLYRIENTTSKYMIHSLTEQKCMKIAAKLKKSKECCFNIIYSLEIGREEISSTFQQMSRQIRYAVFWETNQFYCLPQLESTPMEEKVKIIWHRFVENLQKTVYERDEEVGLAVRQMFRLTQSPEYNLGALHQLLHILENFLAEVEEKEGIAVPRQQGRLYKINDLEGYYTDLVLHIQSEIYKRKQQKYSKVILEIMRYVRKNYAQELTLEMLGDTFKMNGIYLGQIFKKETGTTFLKYFTNYRMEVAKQLLAEGDKNIAEISEAVGYKTSQYFSHIFTKVVGIKPQEYKKWEEVN